MADPVVGIVGLKALRRDLNRMAAETKGPVYEKLKTAGRAVAAPIAASARARLPSDTGTLAGDVRVTVTRTGAGVRMGRKTVPYAGWVEFGGRRSRPHDSARQFIPTGRYLFPAAYQAGPKAAAAYSEALTHIFESDTIWTNTTSNGSQVRD